MVWAGGGYGGQVAVRFDAKKVIRRNLFPGKKPGNREVCDIVKDPAEKNDIAAENRDLIDRAIAILDKEYKPAPGFQAQRIGNRLAEHLQTGANPHHFGFPCRGQGRNCRRQP